MELEINKIFDGKYKIIDVLGKGGMGKVYLVENTNLGNHWAIKQVSKHTNRSIDFLAEPNIMKKLNHPSLPRIFDIVEDDDYIYIILDYIEGTSLDKLLLNGQRFSERQVIEWAKQICDVYSYLHKLKPHPIIYRDMKPSNLMVTPNNDIKVIDFGIAREYKVESKSDTMYLGTEEYAAPEQKGGTAQTDERSDIYSLGVTLFHAITGKRPYEEPYGVLPIRSLEPNLSEGLEYIIEKCTKLDPDQRYQNASSLLQDLKNIAKLSKSYTTRSDEIEKLLESRGTTQQATVVEATRILDETRILEETAYLHSAFKNEHVVETTLLSTDKEQRNSIGIPTTLEEKVHVSKPPLKKKKSAGWKIGISITLIVILSIIGFTMVRDNIIKSTTIMPSNSQTEENLTEELSRVKAGGKWGYINRKGDFVIQPQFENSYNFTEELAAIRVNEKWGYINRKGDFVIQPQFEVAYDFREGMAPVKVGGKWGYIDTKGVVVIQPQFEDAYIFREELAKVKMNGKYGYIDKKGEVVIQPQFEEAYSFREGLAKVKIDGKYGFVDKKGNYETRFQFDDTDFFHEGMATVKLNGKWGYIDKKGNFVIQPQFEYAKYFSEELAPVKVKQKYGYIDEKGKLIIQPQFEVGRVFQEGMAPVKLDGKWGYINKEGKIVIHPQFEDAYSFYEGMAAVKLDGKWGYIDKEGKVIIQPNFGEVGNIN